VGFVKPVSRENDPHVGFVKTLSQEDETHAGSTYK
jgi:hypothetical protein